MLPDCTIGESAQTVRPASTAETSICETVRKKLDLLWSLLNPPLVRGDCPPPCKCTQRQTCSLLLPTESLSSMWFVIHDDFELGAPTGLPLTLVPSLFLPYLTRWYIHGIYLGRSCKAFSLLSKRNRRAANAFFGLIPGRCLPADSI